MPGGMPPQTMAQCLDDQDPVPDSLADAQGCMITDMMITGNTVTYTMEYDQQIMQTKNTGEITYKGRLLRRHQRNEHWTGNRQHDRYNCG